MRKGFTLIELLIVLAIIAILSVVLILVINPAELLKQSRDSGRVSDLAVTKKAILVYLNSVGSPSIGTSTCYQSGGITNGTTTANCNVFFPTAISTSSVSSTKTDGTGWIPVNLASMIGGSPISAFPKDPLNNDSVHFYSYIASSTQLTFKLNAYLESSKYGNGGTNDKTSIDGGVDSSTFEQGTNLTL